MEALNFSGSGLPLHAHYAKKSRGALFAFSASSFDLLTGDHIGDVGVDTFLSEICKTNGKDGHMETLIEYSLYSKDKYQQHYNLPPKNKVDAAAILAKAQSTDDIKVSKSSPSSVADMTSRDVGLDISDDGTHATADMSVDATGVGNDASAAVMDSLPSGSLGSSFSASVGNILPFVTPRKKSVAFSVDKDYPVDLSDSEFEAHGPVAQDSFRTATALKAFLKELFSCVSGQTHDMCLRLQQLNGGKMKSMLSFVKFLDEHKDSTDEDLLKHFLDSPQFTKTITCCLLVPFLDEERYNIVPDGYCFYRALFQLLLRAHNGLFDLSAFDMKEQDKDINLSEGGGRRQAFHKFFEDLDKLLPECFGKSRVLNAQITFFNLKSHLDEAFWGILDAVAFVDFPCSGFSYCKDKSLPGYWAKYRCSSIFGLDDGRESVVEDNVGHTPSVAEIAQVLQHKPNFIFHKINHFFVSDHPAQECLWHSFETCLTQMLCEMRRRFLISLPTINSECISFSQVFDRNATSLSTADDELFVRAATVVLKDHLASSQIVVVAEMDEVFRTPPSSSSIHRSKRVLSPLNQFGDSQSDVYASLEQSVICCVVLCVVLFVGITLLLFWQFVDQESELESLKEELEALKRMIIFNAVAKENPVILDGQDQMEMEQE
jgi:hypothetical protein